MRRVAHSQYEMQTHRPRQSGMFRKLEWSNHSGRQRSKPVQSLGDILTALCSHLRRHNRRSSHSATTKQTKQSFGDDKTDEAVTQRESATTQNWMRNIHTYSYEWQPYTSLGYLEHLNTTYESVNRIEETHLTPASRLSHSQHNRPRQWCCHLSIAGRTRSSTDHSRVRPRHRTRGVEASAGVTARRFTAEVRARATQRGT